MTDSQIIIAWSVVIAIILWIVIGDHFVWYRKVKPRRKR